MTVVNDATTSSPSAEAFTPGGISLHRSRRIDCFVALAMGILTLLLFIRAAGFDYLNLDDWAYVKGNVHVTTGWSLANFRWAFTTFDQSNYHPLTWLGLQSIAQLTGPQPAGFHLANILLHALNAALLYLLLVQLTQARWRSGIVAALFAFHPLRLESVAWIAEFKDVLCATFFLLTLMAYGQYALGWESKTTGAPPKRIFRQAGWYFSALILFGLGLLAKPMLATLPCVLLLIDFWPLKRRVRWTRLLIEKIPFALITAASCVITYIAQRSGGAVGSTGRYPLLIRFGNALWAYGRYLRKSFWPDDLAIFYPYRGVVPHTNFPWGLAIASAIVLVLITLLAIWLWRRERAVLVGWLWFLGMLVPTIGIVQVGGQSMADRYSYLPQIGLLIAIIWGAACVLRLGSSRFMGVGLAAAGAAIVALGITTLFQLSHWQNSYTLFSHAISVTDHNAIATSAIGRYFEYHGDSRQAMDYFIRAYRIDPSAPAVETYLGGLIRDLGRPREALPHLERAVRLNPKDADAQNNLANTLADLGRYPEALEHFDRAVELDPTQAQAWLNYAVTLASTGQIARSLPKFQQALSLRPDDANVHYLYAMALERDHQATLAAQEYAVAAKLRPDWSPPARALIWLLATSTDSKVRNPAQAIAQGEAVNQASAFSDADLLDALSAAYAAAGRFDQAISTAHRARELAAAHHQPPLVEQIDQHLARYQAHELPQALHAAPPAASSQSIGQ
jgi:tetratricopeptide (TPR) repeat protein